MPIHIDSELPGWVRDKLKLPPSDHHVNGYKSDRGNWVFISNSFAGVFSTPAPGTIEFSVDTYNNENLVNTYFRDLGTQMGIGIESIQLSHPLYPFFAQVVADERSSDSFLGVLRDMDHFSLDEAIVHWQEADLPAAEAWYDADKPLIEVAAQLSYDLERNYEAALILRAYRWNSGHIVHDRRQYLLFGQTTEKITDLEWIQAAWPFIQHFRVNFGMFVTEASIYNKVTIVGSQDIEVPVTSVDEAFLRSSGEEDGSGLPDVERLRVTTPDELATVLEERISQNESFGESEQEY